MAAITDPSAIAFINSRVRPLADARAKLYNLGVMIAAEFTAKGMAALIPNDNSVVNDGSQATAPGGGDGRTSITGADVNVLLALSNMYIADMQANSNLTLNQTLKVAVNTNP